MLKNIKNIVFSGASTKIYLFIGFLKYIKEFNNDLLDNIKNFAGTSSGSIIATGLVLGYTIEEMEELLIKLDLSRFKNIDSDGILNFFDNFGLDDNFQFENLFRIMFKKKIKDDNITFKELFNITNKRLIIVSTNINRKKTVNFCHKNTPNIKVIDALIASISIPLVYFPRKIDNELYLDGCITNHFPIQLFNYSKNQTLGAIVLCKQEYTELKDFFDILTSVVFSGVENQSKEVIKEYKNVIILDSNLHSLNFELSTEIKINTIKEGYEQTYNFFKKNE